MMTPRTLAGVAVLLSLASAPAWAQPEQRAAAAQARGELRAAQLEWRNAARATPGSAATQAALARVSLDIGDGETAERAARAALEAGLDPAAGYALLARAYLVSGRNEELLRDLPQPEGSVPAAGQIAAGRAMALASLGRLPEATEASALAVRLAPQAAEPSLAAAAVALARGDRAASEAAVDALLSREPAQVEALLRKGSLLFDRREGQGALQRFDAAVQASPGYIPALLRRAEVQLALNAPERARADIDSALAVQPNSPPGLYLRALLLARSQDWRGVDATLQGLSANLGAFPDGFLLLATAKHGLGQMAQAEDAARRHFARFPGDARAANLIAAISLQDRRPNDALAMLSQVAARGTADAPALDMLGRLQAAAGRRQEAAAAFAGAAALSPADAGIQSRLAAVRLAMGDVAGAATAASSALRIDPTLAGAGEMLAFAALHGGNPAALEQALAALPPAAREAEAAGVLRASGLAMRLDVTGAREVFLDVLRRHPNSLAARLGLVRLARLAGDAAEAERLLAEVLRLDPGNNDAIAQLGAAAGTPRAAQARALLETAAQAAPDQTGLVVTLANARLTAGDAAGAARLLSTGPMAAVPGPAMQLARAEAFAAAGEWPAAEAASRAALAEAPGLVAARLQLATLLARDGNVAGAESLIEEGLGSNPADPVLQRGLIGLVRQVRGLDAALSAAGRLARGQPNAAILRGDLLMAAQRPADAAQAYADAHRAAPTVLLVTRLASARRAAGDAAGAAAALSQWLDQSPADEEPALMLSQLDLAAGRLPQAEARLEALVARYPDNPAALNNLAWLLGARPADRARARVLAQRAYFLAPTTDGADTLGWIMARDGEASRALPLLRLAAAGARPEPEVVYHLAYALRATGAAPEALAVLAPAMQGAASFPAQAEANRLLAELRAGR